MRKKSKYKPKGVRMDTMAYVKQSLTLVSNVEHAGLSLKIKNHSAMANVVQGKGVRDDIDTLIAAMNVTEALAILGTGSDWRTEIRDALDALHDMSLRGIEKGDKFILTGREMQKLNLAMDIHDAQLDACTVKQLEEGLKLVDSYIRNGRARSIQRKAA